MTTPLRSTPLRFTLPSGKVMTLSTLSDLELVALGSMRQQAQSAGNVGAVVRRAGYWQTPGRTCSVNGGGDYRAQMLLGRLRKKGMVEVRHHEDDGCSMWQLTAVGRKVIR